MIEATDFVEAARARGFDFYAGVPCSYLTPFINTVIQDPTLQYLSCANEGDAVALVAGHAAAGGRGVVMMQNSGLGNAVSPLSSLTWTFRLPLLLIVTWRGEPGVADEPQHQLMGPVTPQMLDTLEIPWALFPQRAEEIDAALDRALDFIDREQRPYALLMRKNTVAPRELHTPAAPAARPAGRVERETSDAAAARSSRAEALRAVIARTPPASSVVLATTGFTGRELYAIEDRPNQLYMVGSMGCVPAMALGLALRRPDLQVVAIDGDGAALMRLGLFATLGSYGPPNLVHLLLDNGVHDSTGGQATVSGNVDFAAIAAACGYPLARSATGLSAIDAILDAPPEPGPRFLHLRIRPGTAADLPRPSITPEQVRQRLHRHLAETGR